MGSRIERVQQEDHRLRGLRDVRSEDTVSYSVLYILKFGFSIFYFEYERIYLPVLIIKKKLELFKIDRPLDLMGSVPYGSPWNFWD